MVKFIGTVILPTLAFLFLECRGIRVKGRVLYQNSQHNRRVPASAIKVTCYEHDPLYPDDFGGTTHTSLMGYFHFQLRKETWRDWWGKAEIYCDLDGGTRAQDKRTHRISADPNETIDFGVIWLRRLYTTSFEAVGKASYRYPQSPAGGLEVECWEQDRFNPDEYGGKSVTKHDGSFTVKLHKRVKSDWWGEPDIFCLLKGARLVTTTRTPARAPDRSGEVNFGAIWVYKLRKTPGRACRSNGCGPNHKALKFSVPPLWYKPACDQHDCCLTECQLPGHAFQPDVHTCNREFEDIMAAICERAFIPEVCGRISEIFSHSVSQFNRMNRWCEIQKEYCPGFPPSVCSTGQPVRPQLRSTEATAPKLFELKPDS